MAEEKATITALGIVVDDGSRRVPIQNTHGEEIGAFVFHPTDVGIIERFNRMAEQFDEIMEPLASLETAEGEEVDLTSDKYAGPLREATERAYAAVDEMFGGTGAAEAFFGSMNPFSPVEGEFYCTRVLNAVGDYIGAQFEQETKKFSERVKKYTGKKRTRK